MLHLLQHRPVVLGNVKSTSDSEEQVYHRNMIVVRYRNPFQDVYEAVVMDPDRHPYHYNGTVIYKERKSDQAIVKWDEGDSCFWAKPVCKILNRELPK